MLLQLAWHAFYCCGGFSVESSCEVGCLSCIMFGLQSRWAGCPRSVMAIAILLMGISLVVSATDAPARRSQPNVLVFLVDDLGYGDLGCYGNDTIETPNIDRLAAQGARYTQLYAAASICTPSRAGFLTGRYPVRLGMTSDDVRCRTLNSPAQPGGLPHVEDTMAEVARAQGYRTGLVGKWHLGLGAEGEYLPTQHGFDSFFGMPVTNVQTCGGKKVYNLIGGHGEVLDRSFLEYWIVLTGKVPYYTLLLHCAVGVSKPGYSEMPCV